MLVKPLTARSSFFGALGRCGDSPSCSSRAVLRLVQSQSDLRMQSRKSSPNAAKAINPRRLPSGPKLQRVTHLSELHLPFPAPKLAIIRTTPASHPARFSNREEHYAQRTRNHGALDKTGHSLDFRQSQFASRSEPHHAKNTHNPENQQPYSNLISTRNSPGHNAPPSGSRSPPLSANQACADL